MQFAHFRQAIQAVHKRAALFTRPHQRDIHGVVDLGIRSQGLVKSLAVLNPRPHPRQHRTPSRARIARPQDRQRLRERQPRLEQVRRIARETHQVLPLQSAQQAESRLHAPGRQCIRVFDADHVVPFGQAGPPPPQTCRRPRFPRARAVRAPAGPRRRRWALASPACWRWIFQGLSDIVSASEELVQLAIQTTPRSRLSSRDLGPDAREYDAKLVCGSGSQRAAAGGLGAHAVLPGKPPCAACHPAAPGSNAHSATVRLFRGACRVRRIPRAPGGAAFRPISGSGERGAIPLGRGRISGGDAEYLVRALPRVRRAVEHACPHSRVSPGGGADAR